MMRGVLSCIAILAASSSFAADVSVAIVDQNDAVLVDAVAYIKVRGASGNLAAPKPAQVDQMNKAFLPNVSIVQTGTPVSFPNSDNIRHHVYSFSPAKVFDLKLYSGRPTSPVVFDKPGIVTLGCNIHDQMIAWILVVDTPWFARMSDRGRAVIASVPDGEYELHTWHPGAKVESAVQIFRVSGSAISLKAQLTVRSIDELRREAGLSGAR